MQSARRRAAVGSWERPGKARRAAMESPSDEAAGGAPAPGSTLGPTCWSAYLYLMILDPTARAPLWAQVAQMARESDVDGVRAIRRRSSCTRWPQSSQRELTKVTCGIYCGWIARSGPVPVCALCVCGVLQRVGARAII